tara:strand:+ start:125 stop:1000 length:876 start_codon:yes stop_codon:yes gene_type:complete
MSKKSNLGKGLGALISEYSTNENDAYLDDSVLISRIKPNKNQPRKEFDESKMQELKDSIKEKGILQPIAVREIKKDHYEIIAGERRYRAAKEIGLKAVPVYILSVDNESEIMEYALIENIQRVDLDPIEESEAYALLKSKYNLSQSEISKKVGKSRSVIANSLRLLKLPTSIKDDLKKKKITMGHAISLLGLKNKMQMLAIADRIKKKKLSVRNVEDIVSSINHRPIAQAVQSKSKIKKIKSLNDFESKLIHKYGTKVSISINRSKKGKITFEYYSEDDLNRILDILINKS